MPFTRTTSALRADDGRSFLPAVVLGTGVLIAWILWFVFATVPVHVSSANARIELTQTSHPIEAPVGGKVVAVHAMQGQQVLAGDSLIELDSKDEVLRIESTQNRMTALLSQLSHLRQEISREEDSLLQSAKASLSEQDEVRARARAAEAAVRLADERLATALALVDSGNTARAELSRLKSEAEQAHATLEALKSSLLHFEELASLSNLNRQTTIERLKRDYASLRGDLEMARTEGERLKREAMLRLIRAPASGSVGELQSLRPGQMVQAGEHLGSILPDSPLRVVATLTPSDALGLVRAGQPARMRLDGFPWTRFGTVSLEVTQVAGEVREGMVQVELALLPDPPFPVPLQHGQPGSVEIEVDRMSPAALLLQSLGKGLQPPVASSNTKLEGSAPVSAPPPPESAPSRLLEERR